MILSWGTDVLTWEGEILRWGAGGDGGSGKRKLTATDWLKLNKRVNEASVERAARLKAKPSRVKRTQARLLARAPETVDETSAQQMRALWQKWYETELRLNQAAPGEAYQQFMTDLAALMAARQMDTDDEDLLILVAALHLGML